MTGKKFLCFAPFAGQYAVHHQIDLTLALGNLLRGGESLVIGCECAYSQCEAIMHVESSQQLSSCGGCALKGHQMFADNQIPYVTLKQFVTDNLLEKASKWSSTQLPHMYENAIYNGYTLGTWCMSSLLTRYNIYVSELTLPHIVPFYQSLIRNAIITIECLEEITQSFLPDVALVFNARFSQYRTAYEFLRSKGVRVITHERGFSSQTFSFYDNAIITSQNPIKDQAKIWQDIPLEYSELVRSNNYINAREIGNDFNVPAFVTYSTDASCVKAKLGLSNHPLIGIFTSTETEMDQIGDEATCDLQIPMIEQIVKAAHELKDVNIVIRNHPNMNRNEFHAPEYKFLSNFYRAVINAPINMRIIMPGEEMSSYALLRLISGAIIPFSSMSMEAIARGISTAASDKAAFSAGNTNAFSNLYNVNWLEVIPQLIKETSDLDIAILQKMYRFIYAYIERVSIKFNSIKIKDHYQADLSASVVDDIINSKDRFLNQILDGIVNNKTIYSTPNQNDINKTDADEKKFFQQLRTNLIKSREDAKNSQKCVEYYSNPSTCRILVLPRKSIFPSVFCERLSHINQIHIDSSGKNWNQILIDIKDKLLLIRDDYICINSPSFSADGNFIMDGLDKLKSSSEYHGLLRGAWLSKHCGTIYDDTVGKCDTRSVKDCLRNIVRQFNNPLELLSLFFFKKEFFQSIIEDLVLSPSLESSCDRIIGLVDLKVLLVVNNQLGVLYKDN